MYFSESLYSYISQHVVVVDRHAATQDFFNGLFFGFCFLSVIESMRVSLDQPCIFTGWKFTPTLADYLPH